MIRRPKELDKCIEVTGIPLDLSEIFKWDQDHYVFLVKNKYIDYASKLYYDSYQASLLLWFDKTNMDTTGWYSALKHDLLKKIIFFYPEHMYTLSGIIWNVKTQLFLINSYLFNGTASNNWTSYNVFGPYDGQMTFQDGHSPIMEGILGLHHDIMFFMTIILIFVCWMLANILYRFNHHNNAIATYETHGTVIEIIWTLIPSFLLIIIAIPTFALLYSLDEGIEPSLTLKVIGHQWYWSYEIAYSYILQETFPLDNPKVTAPDAIKSMLIERNATQNLTKVNPSEDMTQFVKVFVNDWLKVLGSKLPGPFKTTKATDMSWVVYTGWDITSATGDEANYINNDLLPNNQCRYQGITRWTCWPTQHVGILGEKFIAKNTDFLFFNDKYVVFPPVTTVVAPNEGIKLTEKNFDIAFDSFMLPEKELENPLQLRLLEVDAPVLLPIDTHIRVLVSSADVIHSWAIPSLGIKLDAVAGRLNQLALYINKLGTYYGQCSEICGPNHAFMPIVVHGVSWSDFEEWLASFDE